jgi:N-acetylglucosaminyldiphosphoundecaprenol N-acetyl-beta-D-mannosaminyltransferase
MIAGQTALPALVHDPAYCLDPPSLVEPGAAPVDDLARNVYCILGVPVDAVNLSEAIGRIDAAARRGEPFLISTPNLNFLVNSLADPRFQISLLQSDLCTADGMPILWIARLLGLPFDERVAGSDILERLTVARRPGQRLSVFLFGGPDGVADAAYHALNTESGGLRCVGSMYPGYGSVDDLSADHTIDAINASGADFLVVSLGAAKGQAWLLRNQSRLSVPVRAHLGAAINFLAGTVKRAPHAMRKLGLEWLWRIKEEPYLWRRYWADGLTLLRVLLTRVLPLTAKALWGRIAGGARELEIKVSRGDEAVTLAFAGDAIVAHIDRAVSQFREALAARKAAVIVDLSETCVIDARFLGLILMVRKCAHKQGAMLRLVGASSSIRRTLRWHEATFLLSAEGSSQC